MLFYLMILIVSTAMREEELMKLGHLVRSKRISKGFTQNELASRAAVD